MSLSHIKRWILLGHRWLGIGMCLLFFLWFLSGMVMMYVGHPKLTWQERLEHLSPLEASQPLLSPADAFRQAGIHGTVTDLRLANARAGQPVYIAQVRPDSKPAPDAPRPEPHLVALDARTGALLPPTDPATALASAQAYLEQGEPSHPSSSSAPPASSPRQPSATAQGAPGKPLYQGITAEDAHTHSKAMDLHRPLHKVLLPDADQTLLYISGTTGEVVRDAPRLERGFNYLGAWLHWLYLFRDTAIDWTELIIWLSVIGIVSVISGFLSGIIRWRFSRPYRSGSRSPFAPGALRWHHILGLVFALTTFTWIFSGLMSMNPWDIFEADDSIIDARRISSPDIQPSHATATPQALLASATTPVRELQWHTLLGKTRVKAIRTHEVPPGSADQPVLLSARTGKPYNLEPERLRSALFTLQPGYPPRIDILRQDDFYYYSRAEHTMGGGRKPHPLPIWRVRYDDPNQTWLHIDPTTGQVLNEMDSYQRAERWLFALLHSWDWLPLLRNRPLWDIVMLVLAAGGLALSATGIWIAGHRLHIKTRRWRLMRRKTR
jgi:hypothetical protein